MNYVIFGGASAIAQACATLWANKHARFVLIDRSQDRLNIVADHLRARGTSHVETIATDLSDIASHGSLIEQILAATHKKPTTYLFAYGTLGDQKASEASFTVAHQELTTNFVSVASLLTHITTAAPDTPSTLAVISSVAGDRGRASNYVYGTAKGALTIWLAGLRNRLTKEKSPIHVLTIKPGFVDTPMTAEFKKGLLWVPPETVAKDITHAIRKQKDVIYTPWFWFGIMWVIKAIPERIFKKMGL